LQESFCGLIEVVVAFFRKRQSKTTESIGTVGVAAEIRTGALPVEV
jgi:hypothetical protein